MEELKNLTTVKLDEDQQKIVDDIHPEHVNTAINYGISLLGKSALYKQFFKKESSQTNESKDKKVDEEELIDSNLDIVDHQESEVTQKIDNPTENNSTPEEKPKSLSFDWNGKF